VKATPRVIIVPTHYSTISEAINFANDGDTIYVLNGTYEEDYIQVNKPVKLIGENKNATTIKGSVMLLKDGIELKNFSIIKLFPPQTRGYAILLHRCSNILIENNFIQSNSDGIYFQTDPGPAPQNVTILRNHIIGYNVSWEAPSFGIFGESYPQATRDLRLIGNNIEGWSTAIGGSLSGKCEIINNTVSSSWCGVSLRFNEGDNTIQNNEISNCWQGMALDFSERGNTIQNNTISNCWQGIVLAFGMSGNVIRGNIINECCRSFHINSASLEGFFQDIDTSNLVNGKPFCYLVNQTNIEISHEFCSNIGFLAVVNSYNIKMRDLDICVDVLIAYTANCTIENLRTNQWITLLGSENCEFSNNVFNSTKSPYKMVVGNITLEGYMKVEILKARNVTIKKNLFVNYGLSLGNAQECILRKNTIINSRGLAISSTSSSRLEQNYIANNDIGISLLSTNNLTISGNNISKNNVGIVISEGCSGIYIYLNNFVDNEKQVEISGKITNIFFDNEYEGNYWSDYNGTDTNQDGIGDTNIPHLKVDWFPLMGVVKFFNITHQDESYEVLIISNSTMLSCELSDVFKTFDFNVTGPYNTMGFCRTRLSKEVGLELIQNYTLTVNEKEPFYVKNWTESEYTYIYFEYEHPKDIIPPTIGISFRIPEGNVEPGQKVKVLVNVTDSLSGVKSVILAYNLNDSALWIELPMTFNSTTRLYEAEIQVQQANTLVRYKFVAYDNAGNYIIDDNSGQYYVYTVIPEFSSNMILALFVTAILIAVALIRAKIKH
jgi:parallel beta-helix repeat protein